MYRRIAVLSSLAVVAAMFMAVGSAHAASGDVVSCTFEGLSGQLVDDENGTNGIDSINDDRSLDIEKGTYDFRGGGNCSGFDATTGQTIVGQADGENAQIASAGEYANTLCGTGTATNVDPSRPSPGLDTTIDFDADADNNPVTGAPGVDIGTVSDVPYLIDFKAGNGDLDIQGTSYDGGGAVHIQPVSPGNCATTDVAQFEVTGSFTAVGL